MERLQYEMGIQCHLSKAFHFIYHTPVENDLIEHELDHVFIGITDETPMPNPDEVDAFRWIWPADLEEEIDIEPSRFTYWFRQSWTSVLAEHEKLKIRTK